MIQQLLNRLGYLELPRALRVYLVCVTILGPVIAFTMLLAGTLSITRELALLAFVLALLVVGAERFPLHLTHKTSINLASAVYIAMVLTLPPSLPVILTLFAAATAQVLRYQSNREMGLAEPLFNCAQSALYVAAAVPVLHVLQDSMLGPSLGSFGSLSAIVSAAIVMHLVNTGLVAGAAALQMGISPLRVWWHNLSLDLMPQVTLTILGVLTAYVARSEPLALPILVIPGVLIHRAVQQTVRLRVDTHEALASLVEVVELRDPYTAGHSRRVAATSRHLALRLGLTAEEADDIESAGRVHDIGKVALDPAMLQKPGKLNNEEWEQMRMHPDLGANVVERFVAYQGGTSYVRYHHEAWDGSGYPDGLKGTDIPFGARILAVADTFDALTSDRPYRRGMQAGDALEVLTSGAGTQWDAEVVRALLAILREDPGKIPVYSPDEQQATLASAMHRKTSASHSDAAAEAAA